MIEIGMRIQIIKRFFVIFFGKIIPSLKIIFSFMSGNPKLTLFVAFILFIVTSVFVPEKDRTFILDLLKVFA